MGKYIPHLFLKKKVSDLLKNFNHYVEVYRCFVMKDMLRILKQQQLKKSVIKLWLKIKKEKKRKSQTGASRLMKEVLWTKPSHAVQH